MRKKITIFMMLWLYSWGIIGLIINQILDGIFPFGSIACLAVGTYYLIYFLKYRKKNELYWE